MKEMRERAKEMHGGELAVVAGMVTVALAVTRAANVPLPQLGLTLG
jgi:hypothetical protein